MGVTVLAYDICWEDSTPLPMRGYALHEPDSKTLLQSSRAKAHKPSQESQSEGLAPGAGTRLHVMSKTVCGEDMLHCLQCFRWCSCPGAATINNQGLGLTSQPAPHISHIQLEVGGPAGARLPLWQVHLQASNRYTPRQRIVSISVILGLCV